MKFTKYHALGNDYIVVDPRDLGHDVTAAEIKILCDRHYGFGSDGVLFGPLPSKSANFALRIFNPDGSEAEKSGNGLRIFSRYLWDTKSVGHERFSIETKGGVVESLVHNSGKQVSVEMGNVRFTHDFEGSPPIKSQIIGVQGKIFEFYAANVGNPHCVIILDELSADITKFYGPLIENDIHFKNRTNVQFVKIVDRQNIQIEIWERGAGYTLASGSSSTAAAAVVFALGLCDEKIGVHMPGGVIEITLREDFNAAMKGAVCRIGEGNLALEALEH
jgi:diaminopimelate epimerase